jgi:uncharacterized protein (DUF305 family)
MKYFLIIIVVILTAACNTNSNNVQVKDRIDSVLGATPMHDTMQMDKKQIQNPMLESMMATMKRMDTLKMSNDFDVDFANSMIIHHQAAIDMSELQIATGKDSEIITMAKNIITAQKEEIAKFQKFVMNYKLPLSKMDNSDSQNILADAMKDMMKNLSGMKLMESVDDNYVMLMISHHGTAIQMAKDEITFGKQKELKAMAEKIITTQTAEVNKFVGWSTHLK